MRTNSFTIIMSKKSNAELENIFENKENYTEEAVQAVTWELENRNIIEKSEFIMEEPKVKTPVTVHKELVKNKEDESPFEDLELPTLYSKKAIQGFTIFFGTLFGMVLLMSNLKKMNQSKVRIEVLVFGIIYAIGSSILVLNYLPKTIFITLLFNIIGYAILTEYFWNKSLGKDLKHRKKKIWKPLIISLIVVVFVVFLQYLSELLQ
ncbi:hypothetical protein H9I45_08805 [Polaribacter haliotis]|uniref:Uncharacterized protein n=1 Tax=Polaribacter haliotis TaxID=1888915 RepID=A0A7L8ABU4_9FLAO|nr:hypothetical protein [Polaribacter haliotis]QOD59470.1 hypothetical protein H9I45_08805 [Polaribacter haliotis]